MKLKAIVAGTILALMCGQASAYWVGTCGPAYDPPDPLRLQCYAGNSASDYLSYDRLQFMCRKTSPILSGWITSIYVVPVGQSTFYTKTFNIPCPDGTYEFTSRVLMRLVSDGTWTASLDHFGSRTQFGGCPQ